MTESGAEWSDQGGIVEYIQLLSSYLDFEGPLSDGYGRHYNIMLLVLVLCAVEEAILNLPQNNITSEY
jgi:hypothetical protein